MLKRDLSFIEGICALATLLGIGFGAWVKMENSIVRLEERAESQERRYVDSVKVLTHNQERFTETIGELNNVLRELSVHMGRIDERLGGVEEKLRDIKEKI